MPDINDYIPAYTPLWRGEDDCGKCDAIIIPPSSKFYFMIPRPINNGQTTYQLFINGLPSEAYIKFDDADVVGDYFYVQISTDSQGRLTMTPTAGIEYKLPCGCYEFELGTFTVLFPDVFINRLGIKWQIATLCPNQCNESPLQVDYSLECGESPLTFSYYLDAYLATLPLTLADEVNAVDGNGRNRRIFSRLQGNKELRVRPLTLATHELLEHVLNLPSFGIDGVEYTQAEGGIYTFVDSGSSGYYVGRVELSATGKVMRLCCDEISPSS